MDGDKDDEDGTQEQADGGERHVDGDGVVVELGLCGGSQEGLRQVDEAREGDDGAVDAAKGGETEDFCCVVAAVSGEKERC